MMVELLREFYNNRTCTLFPPITEYEILQFVHPLKQKVVECLLNNVTDDLEILIIFGSSVNDHHRESSDLDIAVIPKFTKMSISSLVYSFDNGLFVDIVEFNSFDDLIKQSVDTYSAAHDILYKGIPVFVRGVPFQISPANS